MTAFWLIFTKFAKEDFFKEKYREKIGKKDKVNYLEGIKLVKFDLSLITLSMAAHLMVYPALFFSLKVRTLLTQPPPAIMGQKTWINVINFDTAILATIGRYCSTKKIGKGLSYITWPLMVISVGTVIYLYFNDLGDSNDWICWLVLGLITFNMFRTACCSTYHAIECGKKATPKTKTAIGALNGNSVTFGFAIGNLSCHFIKFLKGRVNL